jgi:CRISPR-associated protein Csd2
MMTNEALQTVDFSVVFEVIKANPNGDPLNGNLPRQDLEGRGEVSDVAIRRKIRNVLQSNGNDIFVQSDDRATDGFTSLTERFESVIGKGKGIKKPEEIEEAIHLLTDKYIDIRLFGQLITFNKSNAALRGPVTITNAETIGPVTITRNQIVKSVNGEHKKDGSKAPDRMGEKHRVEYGLYRFNGRINTLWAEKSNLRVEDVEKLKQALVSLFENDESAARPAGSMNVLKVYWWEHGTKQPQNSAKKSYDTVQITLKDGVLTPTRLDDFIIAENTPEDFKPTLTVIEGQ